jgi:hypothetical protein
MSAVVAAGSGGALSPPAPGSGGASTPDLPGSGGASTPDLPGSGGAVGVFVPGDSGGSVDLPSVGASGGYVQVVPASGGLGATGGLPTSSRDAGSRGGDVVSSADAAADTLVPTVLGDGAPVDPPIGTTAYLSVDSTSVDLGSITLGKSASTIVIVTNTGVLSSGFITVTPGTGLTVTGCPGKLAASASCALTISATPSTLGSFAGNVSIASSPGTTTPIQVTVSAATVQGGQFVVAPAMVALGNIFVGTPIQVTVTITALTPVIDLNVTLSGPDIASDPSSTCTRLLAADTACTKVVNFIAASVGPKNDGVVVSAGGLTKSVPITATALTRAKLAMTPSTAVFAVKMGAVGTAITFSIANAGDVASGALNVAVLGANAEDFGIVSNTCMVLAPLALCSVSVVFSPKSSSSESASLVVTDTGEGASWVSAVLTGTGY